MDWSWNGAGSGALSGAGAGAQFGPWGAAIGGGAGALMGGLKDQGENVPVEDFYNAALQTSMGSRPNTYNPFGSQTWGLGPDGRPISQYMFTGPSARTMEALQANMLRAANYDPTKARDQAIQSNYQQGMSRLQPLMDKQNTLFRSQIANSGLDNTEAGTNAADTLNRGQNDAWNSLMATSIDKGNATQQVQMQQMMQPYLQAQSMMGMLGQQAPNYGQGPNYLAAAGLTQKANDNAADRKASASAGKKGGAGSMLGGMGGKKGGGRGGQPNNEYNPNMDW